MCRYIYVAIDSYITIWTFENIVASYIYKVTCIHSCTDNLELLIEVTTTTKMQSHTEIAGFVMDFGCVII